MNKLLAWAPAPLCALLATAALAANAPTYTDAAGFPQQSQGVIQIAPSGAVTGEVGSAATVCSPSFTRPATTPTYASAQLVANSATAGSVAPLQCTSATRYGGGTATVTRVRLWKSTTTTKRAAPTWAATPRRSERTSR
jgi:hypothetical protein